MTRREPFLGFAVHWPLEHSYGHYISLNNRAAFHSESGPRLGGAAVLYPAVGPGYARRVRFSPSPLSKFLAL